MKSALMCLGVAWLSLACGASGGPDKPSNTAGTSSGGSAGGSSGGSGGSSAGMTTGGNSTQAGSSSGGNAGAGGAAGGSAGSNAGGGGSGGSGGGFQAFKCPDGASEAPKLTGLSPKRVEGVPPADAFNNMGKLGTNIEGPVWIGDALYVSEIAYGGNQNPPPSRVLKITATDQVTIAILPDSGSNGLAVNAAGELIGALHKDGSISKLSLTGGAAVPLVTTFMGQRFGSPNDLTFHSNGTMYFSDPSWQAPSPNPQAATRAYRVPMGGQPEAIEVLNQPNGVTLSKNQDFLYIGGGQLKRYPVMADGSLGTGTNFGGGGSDGMVIDCGDNLYVTQNGGVQVYSPQNMLLGTVPAQDLGSVTNVAFGGPDGKTLYITGQGDNGSQGLLKVQMNVVGYPY